MYDCMCDLFFYLQNLLLICWNWLDVNKVTAIITTIMAVASATIAWFTYKPIRGHEFSIMPVIYIKESSEYIKELILFNLKNKTEVVCKIYAKLKNGNFLILDLDEAGQITEKKLDILNPLIIGPYQSKKLYIRRAAYFKQRTTQKVSQVFNYLDIENSVNMTDCYYIVLSDGEFLKAKDLKPNEEIVKFENNNIIIGREVCCGKVTTKNKVISKFKLYNHNGRIVVIFSNDNYFCLNNQKEYSEQIIKQEISKKAKLSRSCTINLDTNISEFLQTLKQKGFSNFE